MFGRIFKQWFWDCYDSAGRLLVLNFLLFLLFFPAGMAMVAWLSSGGEGFTAEQIFVLTAAAGLAGLPPLLAVYLAGMMAFGQSSTDTADPSFRDFLRGVRRHGLRMWGLALLAVFGFFALMANVVFYLNQSGEAGGVAVVPGLMLGLSFWMTLLLGGIVMHGAPLVVRRGMGPLAAAKGGLYLCARYPIATLGIVLFVSSVFVLGAALRMVGLVFFSFSLGAMFLNSAHDVLIDFEEARERRAEEDKAGGREPRRASWKEIREAEVEEEVERLDKARYDRTWQDILRPWEM